jgi:type IV pilus assembly protein PilX
VIATLPRSVTELRRCGAPPARRQGGIVLVTALLLLIVVTILAVGMFRSFGIDEKIAGNMREKHRAINAAETAEEYAEWWLASGNATPGVNCNGVLVAPAAQVCLNAMTNAQSLPLPWTTGVQYVPTNAPTVMDVLSLGGPPGPNTYSFPPMFYISYLGPAPIGGVQGTVYQIDAVGYAGSPDTAAIVEATYLVQTNVKNLTQNPEQ